MTAKKVVQGLIVTAALCLSTTSVRAQGYRFFIMGGTSSLTDKRTFGEGPNSSIPYGSAYAAGGKVIAGVEVAFYKIFGIEASYGFGANNLEITNFNPNPATVLAYGVRNNRFSGDIVGHVPGVWRGIRAYGVVGLEYDLFSPTSSAQTLAKTEGFAFAPSATLASQGKAGFNAGGGIDYNLVSKVDLRLDARYHSFGSPTYGLPQAATSTSAAYFPVGGPAHDIEYSIGLVYRFGKSK
ncbi:MAG: outer membrane beta-barrel protein [Terriglobia bacterium]|jgi:opacity protein-like surface antigen